MYYTYIYNIMNGCTMKSTFQDGALAWEALDYLLNEERCTDVQLEQKTYHGYHTPMGKKEKAEKEAKEKKKNKKKTNKKSKDEL